MIMNLQRETRAELINCLQPVGNSLWVPVIVIGRINSIIAAYAEINKIVEEGIIFCPVV